MNRHFFVFTAFLLVMIMPNNLYAKGDNQVFNVIQQGDLNQLKKYLDEDPSHLKEPLINYASESGQIEILQYLISKNIDVNQKGWMDMMPLSHLVSPWGWKKDFDPNKLKEIVKILIDAGADVNSLDLYGENAVYWATESGYGEVVKVLLEEGGRPYITKEEVKSKGKDIFFSTALHRACLNGYFDIVKLLIEADAPTSIDIKNDSFDLPINIARERGHNDIVLYLENIKSIVKIARDYSEQHLDQPPQKIDYDNYRVKRDESNWNVEFNYLGPDKFGTRSVSVSASNMEPFFLAIP